MDPAPQTLAEAEAEDEQLKGQGEDQLNGPRDEQLNGPTDDQLNGPGEDQLNVPRDDQLNGPTDDQLNGPTDDQLSGPIDDQLNGPTDDQLNGPTDDRLNEQTDDQQNGPTADQLNGLTDDQLSGLTDDQLNGPTDDRLNEQTDDQQNGPTDDQLNGPTDDQLNGPRGDQLNGPTDDQLNGPTGDQLNGPKGEEVEQRGPSQRPAPPSSLPLSSSKTKKKKVLSAPTLSLSLGGGSVLSEDLSGVLSPSVEELELDLEALDTPSDSESLLFPLQDLDLGLDPDLEDDMRRLGVGSCRASSSRRRSLGLDPEDTVDGQGSRWRCLSSNGQMTQVNMSLIQDYVRVISHGGYYGNGENDIIVFSSCFLPENSISDYEEVMDHLFRYVMGMLELMVSQNYLVVYLCAGAQKNQVPSISWLRECYTTIDRRLRKNLKGFLVVHPTWFIKALITIIKPFISSKFSKKLRFVDSLQELSELVPTEQTQIPDCVKEFDLTLS